MTMLQKKKHALEPWWDACDEFRFFVSVAEQVGRWCLGDYFGWRGSTEEPWAEVDREFRRFLDFVGGGRWQLTDYQAWLRPERPRACVSEEVDAYISWLRRETKKAGMTFSEEEEEEEEEEEGEGGEGEEEEEEEEVEEDGGTILAVDTAYLVAGNRSDVNSWSQSALESIDAARLRKRLSREVGRKVTYALWCGAKDGRADSGGATLERNVREAGFETRYRRMKVDEVLCHRRGCDCKHQSEPVFARRQAGVDVDLAVRTLELLLLKKAKCVILVAGDGDFEALGEAVLRAGASFYLCAYAHSLSPNLGHLAQNNIIHLDTSFFHRKQKQTKKPKASSPPPEITTQQTTARTTTTKKKNLSSVTSPPPKVITPSSSSCSSSSYSSSVMRKKTKSTTTDDTTSPGDSEEKASYVPNNPPLLLPAQVLRPCKYNI